MQQMVILILYILDSMKNSFFFIYSSGLVLSKTRIIRFCHKTFPNPSTPPFPCLFLNPIPSSLLPPLPQPVLPATFPPLALPSSLSTLTPPSCRPLVLPFLACPPHCFPLPPSLPLPSSLRSPPYFWYHNNFWERTVFRHLCTKLINVLTKLSQQLHWSPPTDLQAT